MTNKAIISWNEVEYIIDNWLEQNGHGPAGEVYWSDVKVTNSGFEIANVQHHHIPANLEDV